MIAGNHRNVNTDFARRNHNVYCFRLSFYRRIVWNMLLGTTNFCINTGKGPQSGPFLFQHFFFN